LKRSYYLLYVSLGRSQVLRSRNTNNSVSFLLTIIIKDVAIIRLKVLGSVEFNRANNASCSIKRIITKIKRTLIAGRYINSVND
jgi:hypothetical protein